MNRTRGLKIFSLALSQLSYRSCWNIKTEVCFWTYCTLGSYVSCCIPCMHADYEHIFFHIHSHCTDGRRRWIIAPTQYQQQIFAIIFTLSTTAASSPIISPTIGVFITRRHRFIQLLSSSNTICHCIRQPQQSQLQILCQRNAAHQESRLQLQHL